jgi:hypothetical protein
LDPGLKSANGWPGGLLEFQKGMVGSASKSLSDLSDFRLAKAPSNLYPMDREEKRFLDAMLIGMPRL